MIGDIMWKHPVARCCSTGRRPSLEVSREAFPAAVDSIATDSE